ncbi:MAG: phytanoyl-CoA dioxygenase family protein [Rhodobacter sp.]|nr:phytanoyl-CoA dioxygenase family protein [Rhodobacter sp.]
MGVLTEDQIAAFRRDGYLHVPAMYSAAEAAEISAWTDALSSAPEVAGKDWKYFEDSATDGSRILCRIENFVPHHAGFARLILDQRMAEAVSELFGEEAVLFKDKINFKLPGGDGFKSHQDVQAGWDAYGPLHITAMIAIDATTAENGSLEMLPGMHKQGLLGQMWAPLSDDDTGHQPFQPVHCAPGDAVFFDSYAPHRSAPNRTDQARRVLYITYNAASAGDHRAQYYADKHKNFPPDIERDPDRDYAYKV